jgi:hypothetical protein
MFSMIRITKQIACGRLGYAVEAGLVSRLCSCAAPAPAFPSAAAAASTASSAPYASASTAHPTDFYIADSAAAWSGAGFGIKDGSYAEFGEIRLWFQGEGVGRGAIGGKRGVTAWSFANLNINSNPQCDELCSIPLLPRSEIVVGTGAGAGAGAGAGTGVVSYAASHPNGVAGIDHIVLRTACPDWVESEFLLHGIKKRRENINSKLGFRYSFYRPSNTILEVVSKISKYEGASDGCDRPKAYIWGITFATHDIEFTHNKLKGLTKPPWDAVQAGRRITTLNTNAVDISTKVAFISPHVARTSGAQ